MKKAYIFDMDGVIVDSEKYYHRQRLNFLKEQGLKPGVSDLKYYVGASFKDGWKMMVPDEKLWDDLFPKFNQYFAKHKIDYAEYVHVHVGEFLKDLKRDHRTVTIASAGGAGNIYQMLDQCNFQPYFDSVLSGESVERNKPAPDIYLESARKIGCKPEECIALEDSVLGIRAAKTAGLETWALSYPEYQIDQSQADHVFNGFGEVRKYYSQIMKSQD